MRDADRLNSFEGLQETLHSRLLEEGEAEAEAEAEAGRSRGYDSDVRVQCLK